VHRASDIFDMTDNVRRADSRARRVNRMRRFFQMSTVNESRARAIYSLFFIRKMKDFRKFLEESTLSSRSYVRNV
jgi:hypothetical protein